MLQFRKSQHIYTLSASDWEAFTSDDVVHLYTTNKEVEEHNAERIKKLNSPIVKVEAEHTGDGVKASSNTASGLNSHALYFIGTHVLD